MGEYYQTTGKAKECGIFDDADFHALEQCCICKAMSPKYTEYWEFPLNPVINPMATCASKRMLLWANDQDGGGLLDNFGSQAFNMTRLPASAAQFQQSGKTGLNAIALYDLDEFTG